MEKAKRSGYLLYTIPEVQQPRMSSFYFWAALVQLFEALGLVTAGSAAELSAVTKWLEPEVKKWAPTIASSSNQAKQISKELMGKSIVVYSGPLLYAAAHKWKICFNENAKNLSWDDQYPEFNHNEFIGWTGQPVNKLFAVVEIRSQLDNERIKKRFLASERLLSGQRPAPEVVEPRGDNLAQQLAWTAALGDFVSIYLALLNGVNPSPVELVEKLKRELG